MKRILLLQGQDDSGSSVLSRRDDGSMEMQLHGNVPIEPAFEGLGEVDRLVLGMAGSKIFTINHPDVVVNLICDADTNQRALGEAAALVGQMGKPVINHPEKVMKTGRQSIAQMAAEIAGILAPPVIILRPRRLSEIEELWRSGALPADFLIRPLSGEAHGGKRLLRVSSGADLGALEQYPFDGGPFGITAFVDSRNPDGYYRKYRLVFINGEAYPRHLIIDSNWMIHARSRDSLMIGRDDLQAEERRYLNNPRAAIGPKAWGALQELAHLTKLNYVGMDFSLLPDGRALLFECNAGMNVFGQSGGSGGFAYIAPVVERIKTALEDLVTKRLEA